MRAVTAITPLALPRTLAFAALAFGVLAFDACAPPASIYCRSDNNCPSGYACDPESSLCLPSVELSDAGEVVDGAQDAAGLDRARDAAELDLPALDSVARDQAPPDQEAPDSHLDDVNIVIDGGPRDRPDDEDNDATILDSSPRDLQAFDASDGHDSGTHDSAPVDIGTPDQDPGEVNTGRVDSNVSDVTVVQDSSMQDNFLPDNGADLPDTSLPDIGGIDAANLCTLTDGGDYDPNSCGSGDWQCSSGGVCLCEQGVRCEDFCPPTSSGIDVHYCCSDDDCGSHQCNLRRHICFRRTGLDGGGLGRDRSILTECQDDTGCSDSTLSCEWGVVCACPNSSESCAQKYCMCSDGSI